MFLPTIWHESYSLMVHLALHPYDTASRHICVFRGILVLFLALEFFLGFRKQLSYCKKAFEHCFSFLG